MENKFGPINGFEDLEPEEELPESSDIEYGTLVMKFKSEPEPIAFDIFSDNQGIRMFLMKFCLEHGGNLLKEFRDEENS